MKYDNEFEIADDIITVYVENISSPTRVDKFLSEKLTEYSRSYIRNLIDDKRVTVNNKVVKGSIKVSEGEIIVLNIPPIKTVEILPENIPIDILYEDEDIIVVNKPKGMVVHPSAGHFTGTLVNALMYHCKDKLSGINGEMRPGIVHRIDKDTTGVIIACKNDHAHRFIAKQLKEHSVTRKYNAIVYNCFKEENGTVDAPIGRHNTDRKKMSVNNLHGKNAVTHYRILKNYEIKQGSGYAYIECRLETGRTHQIRVHMTSIGHPLLGDEVYGTGKNPFHLDGQALHAEVLGFIHPSTEEYMEFHAPLPEYFASLLKKLDNMTRQL